MIKMAGKNTMQSMMERGLVLRFIKHRINKLEELENLAEGLGAELDIRASERAFYIHHDAHTPGDDLEEYLKLWASKPRGTLILNTKEDGLEAGILELLKKYSIEDFFFLDTAFPTLVKWSQKMGESRFAMRISEYEPPVLLERFRGKVEWVWLDCFNGKPASKELLEQLDGFKICVVSPELQGYSPETIKEFELLKKEIHAVCTKSPEEWGWRP